MAELLRPVHDLNAARFAGLAGRVGFLRVVRTLPLRGTKDELLVFSKPGDAAHGTLYWWDDDAKTWTAIGAPITGHDPVTAADGGHSISGQAITSVSASDTNRGHVEHATEAEAFAGLHSLNVPAVARLPVLHRENKYTYKADTGSANAYAIALTPGITVYALAQFFHFKAASANTGVSTLQVNGITGPKTIKKHGTADLVANDIKAGQMVTVMYDGTNFQMISQLGNAPGGGGGGSQIVVISFVFPGHGPNAGSVMSYYDFIVPWGTATYTWAAFSCKAQSPTKAAIKIHKGSLTTDPVGHATWITFDGGGANEADLLTANAWGNHIDPLVDEDPYTTALRDVITVELVDSAAQFRDLEIIIVGTID